MRDSGSSDCLKKELSLLGVYTLGTGATLSSGFFLLPALAAAEAGPAVVLSYLVAVVPLLPGVLSKIELATAMPRAGGEYYFLDRSLGPLIGTIGGLGTWFGLGLKTAFALVGIGAYLRLFLPNVPVQMVSALLAIVFGVLNYFGARKTTAFQTALVLFLLLLLTWFVTSGLMQVEFSHFERMTEKGWSGILSASGLVCVSFMGLTNVASVAEEVKNPEQNLTVGILLALLTAVVVYGLGTFVIVGVVPASDLYTGPSPSLTPVADAAQVFAGNWGSAIMTLAALLAFLSVANAGILSASRYPLAMSRDHLLPEWFAKLNRYQTPQNGILVTVGLILVFVTVFDPTKIAKLASAFLLLLLAFNCLAVIVMRESKIESYDPGFRTPFYPWLQLMGIIGPAVLILIMGWLPIVFSVGLITAGTVWYLRYGQPRVVRGGAIYHLFARLGQHRFEGLDQELRGILKEKGLRADDPYDEVIVRSTIIDERGPTSFEQIVLQASEKLAVYLPQRAEELEADFMEGTRVGATPTSKGVALPHLRMPGLEIPLMVVVRSVIAVHVDVESEFAHHAKEDPIHAVIFLVSPEEDASQHLRILAQVAQRVDQPEFLSEWLAANSELRLREILLREDRFASARLRRDTPWSSWIGQTLRDLKLPPNTFIALIHRNDQMIIPRDNTVLKEGDCLTVVGLPKSIERLKQMYKQV